VAGSRVDEGELDSACKYRIWRNEECIAEDLIIHSLKKFKTDVKTVAEGMECGVAFKNLPGGISLAPGDLLECYREKQRAEKRFDDRAGLRSSY